jgi:hypothetical protein
MEGMAYGYNPETRVKTEMIKLKRDLLNGGYQNPPANSIQVEFPELSENQTALVRDDLSGWKVVSDYRGLELYDKKTGERYIIGGIGEEPDYDKFTKVKPSGKYPENYDESTDSWVFDSKSYRVLAISYLSELCLQKRREVFPDYKFLNLTAGIVYDDPYTIANYKATSEKFRSIYYDNESLIKAASTKDSIDGILSSIEFPTEVVTAGS